MLDVLSTAFALICLAACAFAAWQAHNAAEDARDEAAGLIKTQHKLASHDLSLNALHAAVKRIDGKVGAMQRPRPARPIDDMLDEDGSDGAGAAGSDRSYAGPDQMDPELAAELQLQRAPSRSPGG